jgi:hypothetical protein
MMSFSIRQPPHSLLPYKTRPIDHRCAQAAGALLGGAKDDPALRIATPLGEQQEFNNNSTPFDG